MSIERKYPDALSGLATSKCADGTTIYWQAKPLNDLAVLQAQQDFANPRISNAQFLLKKARQRFIFQQRTTQENAIVFKLFPLSNFFSRLRHRKYAYREFVNTLQAQNLGVNTPKPLAFLEKRRLGMVNCSGLILESLDGYSDLLLLYEEGILDYKSVSEFAGRVIVHMAALGVNHIDLRDENIMLNPDTRDIRVIDWQYANFWPSQTPWLLEYLSAYFIRLAPEKERDSLIKIWLPTMHSNSHHSETYVTFKNRVSTLIQARPRTKQRLALDPVKIS